LYSCPIIGVTSQIARSLIPADGPTNHGGCTLIYLCGRPIIGTIRQITCSLIAVDSTANHGGCTLIYLRGCPTIGITCQISSLCRATSNDISCPVITVCG